MEGSMGRAVGREDDGMRGVVKDFMEALGSIREDMAELRVDAKYTRAAVDELKAGRASDRDLLAKRMAEEQARCREHMAACVERREGAEARLDRRVKTLEDGTVPMADKVNTVMTWQARLGYTFAAGAGLAFLIVESVKLAKMLGWL